MKIALVKENIEIKEYLEKTKKNEESLKKPGWLERIKSINNLLKETSIIEAIDKNYDNDDKII